MRSKDENKRVAIRQATIAVVISQGLGSASVARIAAQASVSVGTVYVYYPNKDLLLQEVYVEVKQAFHERVMAAFDPQQNSANNLRAMWFALYAHVVEHAHDFVFTELISAAHLLDLAHQQQVELWATDMLQVLQQAVADGTLKDLSISTLRACLIAPAIHLARQAAATGQAFAQADIDRTFDVLWQAVSKDS
jgi:AcrR family transcriptional regulator